MGDPLKISEHPSGVLQLLCSAHVHGTWNTFPGDAVALFALKLQPQRPQNAASKETLYAHTP